MFQISKCIFLFLLLSVMIFSKSASAEPNQFCSSETVNKPLKATYFAIEPPQRMFWRLTHQFMTDVAASLGVELKIEVIGESVASDFKFLDYMESILKKDRPDMVLGHFYLNGETEFLELLESLQIKHFSINSNLGGSLSRKIGLPRQKYKYWLGHMKPNEFAAGKASMEWLLNNELVAGINVAAVAGVKLSLVSRNRVLGMLDAKRIEQINLLPTLYTDWSKASAKSSFENLLRRARTINKVWTAGGETALGVIDVLNENNIQPGKDVLISTFDWTPKIIEMIKAGKIDTSYGGHFTEGGWGLLLLYDYINGFDFAAELNTNILTELTPIHKGNVSLYEELVVNEAWKDIDFKQRSKCFNPNLTSYDFSLH